MVFRRGSFVTGHLRAGHWVTQHYRGGLAPITAAVAADMDVVNKRTPLMRAAMEGDVGRVVQLLSEGTNPNTVDTYSQSALYYSTINGHPDISEILIGHGADIVQKEIADKVLAREKYSASAASRVSQGWSRGEDNFSLGEILNALADLDISIVDERGRTPLIRAAIRGDLAAVEFFIENGASVNHLDRLGQSALYYATINRRSDVASILEHKGADKSQQEVAERLLQRTKS